MRKILLLALAGILGSLTSLATLAADDAGLLRVLAVQPTDVSAYIHEVDALQALFKKAGIATRVRVWQATYAGPDAGAVVVTIEMPNLAALAKLNDTVKTNAEIGAEMKKINSMRKIVSDSLYDLISH